MLEVRDLAVSYGRHRALEGVSLAVAPGEICVILGANGAGKSTLLKAIAGMVPTERGGAVTIDGRRLTGRKPNRVVEEGVALVPEGRGIFVDLTVAENLQLGAYARRARRDEAATMRRILEVFPRLGERRGQVVRTMSGGEQQMVAIGRALMSRPEILMLDEPSLGLSPKLSGDLFRSLRDVADTGVGILLVEQNARASLRIARRGYLIENGAITGEGSAEALLHDPAVVAAYLGGAASVAATPAAAAYEVPPGRADAPPEELAERAARIHAAFVRAARRRDKLPTAFVGRFDPAAGEDPWAALRLPDHPRPRRAAPEATALGRQAAALAERAAARLAAHVRTERLSAPRPAAFGRPAAAAPPAARPLPRALPPAGQPQPLPAPEPLEWPAGIGHNSAGAALESESDAFAALAARAASIHAAHVARRRQTLSAFTLPARGGAEDRTDPKRGG